MLNLSSLIFYLDSVTAVNTFVVRQTTTTRFVDVFTISECFTTRTYEDCPKNNENFWIKPSDNRAIPVRHLKA